MKHAARIVRLRPVSAFARTIAAAMVRISAMLLLAVLLIVVLLPAALAAQATTGN